MYSLTPKELRTLEAVFDYYLDRCNSDDTEVFDLIKKFRGQPVSLGDPEEDLWDALRDVWKDSDGSKRD